MKTVWFNIVLMTWVASFSFSSIAFENQQGASNQAASVVEQAEVFNLDPFDLDLDATLNSTSPSPDTTLTLLFSSQDSAAFTISKSTDYIRGPPITTI